MLANLVTFSEKNAHVGPAAEKSRHTETACNYAGEVSAHNEGVPVEGFDLISTGAWSIVPPLLALGLALITKEVYSSLTIGVLMGMVIYQFTLAGVGVDQFIAAFTMVPRMMATQIADNGALLLFLALLGALTVVIPGLKYFFGKMTMYPSFNRPARDMILYFLKKHFGDKDALVEPITPLTLDTPEEELRAIFVEDDFKSDYRILNTAVRRLGFNIPPLVNAYMGLSPTMRVFGTAVNHEFGNVEETGILIAVNEILEEKRMRHIDTFATEHPESMEFFADLFQKNGE